MKWKAVSVEPQFCHVFVKGIVVWSMKNKQTKEFTNVSSLAQYLTLHVWNNKK